MCQALIASPDPLLRATICAYYRRRDSVQPEVVVGPDQVPDALARFRPRVLFADVRDASGGVWNRVDPDLCRGRSVVAVKGGAIHVDNVHWTDRVAAIPLADPVTTEGLDDVSKQLRPTAEGLSPCYSLEASGTRVFTRVPEFRDVLSRLSRIAAHRVTPLFVGETGTGKTTLATLMHEISPRRHQPLVTHDCASWAAEGRPSWWSSGHFPQGDSVGTLVLKRIDALDSADQARLLELIDACEAGAGHEMPRLVVSSQVDLEALSSIRDVRSDLFYRLSMLQFVIPPLRERTDDVVPLALQFAASSAGRFGCDIDRLHGDFIDAINSYTWPGNVRELKHQVERSVLFSEDGTLRADNLGPELMRPAAPVVDVPHVELTADAPAQVGPQSLAEQVAETERRVLEEALRQHGNKRTATAKALGISRVGLYKKMKKLGMIADRDVA